jgi:hypothetical protein
MQHVCLIKERKNQTFGALIYLDFGSGRGGREGVRVYTCDPIQLPQNSVILWKSLH